MNRTTLTLCATLLVIIAADPAAGRSGREDVPIARPAPVKAPDRAESATIRRLSDFYRNVGMDELADRLTKDFAAGNVVFDPNVRKEDVSTAAFVNPHTNRMHVDAGVVSASESGLNGRGQTISLASTIFHEYVHVDQGRAFIQYSNQMHDVPAYETPAWSNQMQIVSGWMQNRRGALERATTDDERLAILRDMAGCRAAYGEVITGIREQIAKGDVTRPDLTSQTLDDLLARHSRTAHEAMIANERLLTDPATRRQAGDFARELAQAHAVIPGATPASAPADTGSVALGAPRPVQVTATGHASYEDGGGDGGHFQPGESGNATLTFWNVGERVPGRGEATLVIETVGGGDKRKPWKRVGTFTGGPNGEFRFPKSIHDRFKLKDGKTCHFWPYTVTVQNPGAFAGWPAGSR